MFLVHIHVTCKDITIYDFGERDVDLPRFIIILIINYYIKSYF